jgi:prephenate dehydratase
VTTVVAYQGEPGAFSELAIVALWGSAATPLSCASFADVIAAVEAGRAELGLLPIENSIAGPVREARTVIERSSLEVIRSTALPIRLTLLAVAGATLDSLRSVESHPVALRQCATFLAAHQQLVPRNAGDTAGAARAVAASRDITRGAIASTRAGVLNGLVTLAEGLEDRADNVTQFAIVARDAASDAAERARRLKAAN